MAVEVTTRGQGGRTVRYTLGGPDDPGRMMRGKAGCTGCDRTLDAKPTEMGLCMAEADHALICNGSLFWLTRDQFYARLVPPAAPAAGVYPHGRRDVPEWSRIESRPPPPAPMPTRAPGRGVVSR